MLRLKLSRERNSRLNWNDNLGAIFEVNLKSNSRAVPVPLNVFACAVTTTMPKSTMTEKMAAVHFPSNALRSKILKKANGCLLKDRRKAEGQFVYSAKISHH